MSKVIVYHAGAKDSEAVEQATIDSGWLPGMAFKYNNTGEYIELADGDETMFIAIDDNDELSTPPTGGLVTVIYGSGTKFVIDHSEEVAAASADRAFAADVLAAGLNDDLHIGADGKWAVAVNGEAKGKVTQIPDAANNFALGIQLRF